MSEVNVLHSSSRIVHSWVGFLRLLCPILRIVFATCWTHSFSRTLPAILGTLPDSGEHDEYVEERDSNI